MQVPTNPGLEAASLNRNAEKIETPTLGVNLKYDRANDVTNSRVEAQSNMPISNSEVSRLDKNSDPSNCNTEFMKPATAESAVNLSNQGIKPCVCTLRYIDFCFLHSKSNRYFL